MINNKNFRTISPNEYIEEGTLVWTERNTLRTGEIVVAGPYILENGWGPIWFGSANENKHESNSKVKLVCTNTGNLELVTWRSFLFTSYYILNEEQACTDAEIK